MTRGNSETRRWDRETSGTKVGQWGQMVLLGQGGGTVVPVVPWDKDVGQ